MPAACRPGTIGWPPPGGPAGTGLGRFFALMMPITVASAVVNTADVPWYIHMPLDVLAAPVPLLVNTWLAAAAVTGDGKRRARRSMPPRPRVAYLPLATGWALAGVLSWLAAWAAGGTGTCTGPNETETVFYPPSGPGTAA